MIPETLLSFFPYLKNRDVSDYQRLLYVVNIITTPSNLEILILGFSTLKQVLAKNKRFPFEIFDAKLIEIFFFIFTSNSEQLQALAL